jgi:hypothetical protein
MENNVKVILLNTPAFPSPSGDGKPMHVTTSRVILNKGEEHCGIGYVLNKLITSLKNYPDKKYNFYLYDVLKSPPIYDPVTFYPVISYEVRYKYIMVEESMDKKHSKYENIKSEEDTKPPYEEIEML